MEEKNFKHSKNNKDVNSNASNDTKGKKIKLNLKEAILVFVISIVLTLIMSLYPIMGLSVLNRDYHVAAKPIIYLYPTVETSVTVELGKPEKLTCSYPKYQGSWNVLANPDGNLVDLNSGRNLYSLYWEGKSSTKTEITEGFCIKGEDSAKFLEEKLSMLGLSDREAEEFIVYWLPQLEANKYNLISFESQQEINDNMPLKITPAPDSLIRVMMKFKGLNSYIKIPEQALTSPKRVGFVVVEWGGTEIK